MALVTMVVHGCIDWKLNGISNYGCIDGKHCGISNSGCTWLY